MNQETLVSRDIPRPIVDIDVARFNDCLEPSHEEVWDKFVTAVEGSKQAPSSIYVPLWRDEEAPVMYRDKAMLRAIEEVTKRFGFGYTPEPLKILSRERSFSKRRFANWLVELNDYQKDSQEKSLEESQLVDFAVQLFDQNHLTTSNFEKILDSVNPALLRSRRVFGRQNPGDDNWREAPYRRLPLLYDALLPGEMTGLQGKAYYRWAAKKLHQWTAKQNGADIALPAWLDYETSDELGKQLYSKLCDSVAPNWSIIGPGIERYGWSLLKKGPGVKVEQIAESIHDRSQLAQFLRYLLIVNNSQRFIGETYNLYNITEELFDKAKELIPESDTTAIGAFQSETQFYEANQIRLKEQQKKWKVESRERNARLKAHEEKARQKQAEAAREVGRLLLLLKQA